MIRGFLIIATFLAPLSPGIRAADDGEARRRPNIVFIYSDDHAQQAVSAYGSVLNKTPNIDALADAGMRFSQSFVGNSICGPARATILTGLHSHANGQTGNRSKFRNDLPTFAKTMRSGGYQTAVVGKWHISSDPTGFDHYAISHGYYNPTLKTSEGSVRRTGYTTDVLTEEGLGWIAKRDASKPFVLWLCHNAVHRTWQPGPGYLTRYDDVEIPEPATLFDDYAGKNKGAAIAQMRIARDLFPAYDLKLPATGKGHLDKYASGALRRLTPEQRKEWQAAYRPKNEAFAKAGLKGADLTRWKYQRYIKDYLRCVDALDDSVGRVTSFLKENGLEENTIVIYSSDQGFFLGEHGWYDKRWIYEPALRTPLIIRWPGVTEPGSVSEALVQNIDMAPTMIDAAGFEVPASMHGKSLTPLLKGETPDSWRDAIYYHYQMDDGKARASHIVSRHYGIRTDRYKLIHIYDHGEWELYDLERDPGEMENLFQRAEYREITADLRKRLRELRRQFGDKTGKPL